MKSCTSILQTREHLQRRRSYTCFCVISTLMFWNVAITVGKWSRCPLFQVENPRSELGRTPQSLIPRQCEDKLQLANKHEKS